MEPNTAEAGFHTAGLDERKTGMAATATAAARLAEGKRLETLAETLTPISDHRESLGELAHDARNMMTAISLYCDLLEEPGVLAASHRHYGCELRLLAGGPVRSGTRTG